MKTTDPENNSLKEFDAVMWTRARRDELHRQYAALSTAEFVRRVARDGLESPLGVAMARKFRTLDATTLNS